MNRRRALFAALVFAPLAAIGVACSFPDVSFNDSPDGSSPDVLSPANEGSTTSDTGSSGGLGPDGSTILDSSFLDVVLNDASTAPVDPSSCGSKPTCDCDNDGYKAADCGVDADFVDANLNGLPLDCDDLVPARHPDAGFSDESDASNFDWNCDSQIERLPAVFGPDCPKSGLTCPAQTNFFVVTPACGTLGSLYSCSGILNLGSCGQAAPTGTSTIENCE